MSDESYNAVPPPDSLKPAAAPVDFSASLEQARAIAAKLTADKFSSQSDTKSQTNGKRSYDDVSDGNGNRSQYDQRNNQEYSGYPGQDSERSNKRFDMGSNKGYQTQSPDGSHSQDPRTSWNNKDSFSGSQNEDNYQSPRPDQSGPPTGDAYKSVGLYSSTGSGPSQDHPDVQTETIDIPAEVVGLLIGKGGETIKNMQSQSNCRIFFNQDLKSENNTKCLIMSGPPQAIALARSIIEEKLSQSSFIRNAIASNDPRMGNLFKNGIPRIPNQGFPNSHQGNRGGYQQPGYQQGYNPNQQQQQPHMQGYGMQSSGNQQRGYPRRTHFGSGPQGGYQGGSQGYQQQGSLYGGYNQPMYGAQQGYPYPQQGYPPTQGYDPSQSSAQPGAPQPRNDSSTAPGTQSSETQSNEAAWAAYYSQMGYQNYPGYGMPQQASQPASNSAPANSPTASNPGSVSVQAGQAAQGSVASATTNLTSQTSNDAAATVQWTNSQYASYYAQYAASYPEYAQYAEYYRQLAASDPNGFPPTPAANASTTNDTTVSTDGTNQPQNSESLGGLQNATSTNPEVKDEETPVTTTAEELSTKNDNLNSSNEPPSHSESNDVPSSENKQED
ncbi:Far upstream element-binding protein 1 [Smittium mucronatum]|uniref:Far upstream element-binding protein 1 n=1 Tax=Smittium mucronatum TaxID=133383 RepID=A0A1R0H3X9_9FUNG|nr:Far upstream element-binding protein 1 [Smittium mucronatum]